MYTDDGHDTSAIEKLVFDQGLSRKRPTSRWGPPLGALIAGRVSPWSLLLTLQVPAGTVLASSPCGGAFLVSYPHFSKRQFVRIDTCKSYILLWKNFSTWTDRRLTFWPRRLRFECSKICFYSSVPVNNMCGDRGWLTCPLSNREASFMYI